MPYVLQPGGGVGVPVGTARAILTGFGGTDAITVAAPGITAANGGNVGDVLEFDGTPGDGNYMIVERVSATSFRVQPTPPVGAVAGTAQGMPVDTLVAAQAVGGYPANNRISVPGATFITNGVRPNDYAILAPNQTNEGIFAIQEVVSETDLIVYTNTSVLSTAAVASDTVEVARAKDIVQVIDETAGTIGAALSGGTVFQNNFGVMSDHIAIARLRDSAPVATTNLSQRIGSPYLLEGIQTFDCISSTGATITALNISNESWINLRAGTYTIGFNAAPNGAASPLELNIGTRTGDEISGKNGALLWGVAPVLLENTANRYTDGDFLHNMRGSASKFLALAGFHAIPRDGEILTSLMEGAGIIIPLSPVSAPFLIDSLNFMSTFGLLIRTDIATVRNYTLDQSGTSFVVSAPNARVDGLLKSDESASPIYNAFQSPGVSFVDPREDYPLSELVTNIFLSTGLQKRYTFDPRFVSRSAGATAGGNPIAGLQVSVFEVNEVTQAETEVPESPFTTDAQGRLPGGNVPSGTGQELVRQEDAVTNSHRIIVEGPGWRRIDQVIQAIRPFQGDLPVDFLTPDLEGELST